jgi:GT2 family glycosyltransferase
MEKEILKQVDVIITTRNRITDLVSTLRSLQALNFPEENIYVVDDASTDGTANYIKLNFKKVHLSVNDTPKGYIVNRNFLMAVTEKPFFLSLDDDSCLIDLKHLLEAVTLLQKNDHYGIFKFKVYEQLQVPKQKAVKADLRVIKNFIGCGHIIKREVLEKVGFYREELYFYCEELDFALKAFKADYLTITKDDLIVHHRIDPLLRESQENTQNNAGIYGYLWRNKMLTSNYLIVLSIHLPYIIDVAAVTFYYMPRLFYELVIRKHGYRGFFSGLKRYLKFTLYILKNKDPLSLTYFNKWFFLPMY